MARYHGVDRGTSGRPKGLVNGNPRTLERNAIVSTSAHIARRKSSGQSTTSVCSVPGGWELVQIEMVVEGVMSNTALIDPRTKVDVEQLLMQYHPLFQTFLMTFQVGYLNQHN
jgi:hypothetical protein